MRTLLFLLATIALAAEGLGQTHYDVVALRVEFQPDTTRFTTGDGTFEGLRWPSGLDPKIDPLPHDAGYFDAHLEFLKHYVTSVSDGKAELTTHLIPSPVRVSGEMGDYSPTGLDADTDQERIKLAALIEEAWGLADTSDPIDLSALDPERTFFVIFHAGIGRDVELLGTILEKTPQDLPSLFFDESTLERLGVSGMTYSSVPVAHTALIPRTESRLGFNGITSDSLLLELSINGLLASSFFGFLGIPDLFNTKTGDSAIGSFGLMDPQGIFAYGGLFPPAPTAWTRQRLGWIDPIPLEGVGPAEIMLPVGGVAQASVSEAEYFLIENRMRDPEGDGLRLRVWQDGTTVEQHIEAVTDEFGRYNVEAFVGGVVTGVDNYDFALPGRDSDGNQYPGGFLIWHVDERLIESGAVNADPDRRGLDLEEADSAQDLGFDNSPGSPFDFYFQGNNTQVVLPSGREIILYENRFGPLTTPSSATNDGGASFIVLENFSAPGPQMTFTYERESVNDIFHQQDTDLQALVGARGSVGGGSDYTFVFDGMAAHVVSDQGNYTVPSAARPVATEDLLIVLEKDDTDRFVIKRYRPLTMEVVSQASMPASLLGYLAQGPLVATENGVVHALFVTDSGSIMASVDQSNDVSTVPLPAGALHLARSSDQSILIVGETFVMTQEGNILWSFSSSGSSTFAPSSEGLWGAMTLPAINIIQILTTGGQVYSVDVSSYIGNITLGHEVTMADIDGDGTHEIVTTASNYLLAFEQGGALVAGFPVRLSDELSTQPLVAVDDTGVAAIYVGSRNGTIFSVIEGQDKPGFPLSVGTEMQATPRLSEGRLEAITRSGILRSYSIGNTGTILWGEQHGSHTNSSLAMATLGDGPEEGSRLLVPSETYNWPNPIRSGHTFMRTMTTEDATVDITIIDMAGTVVHETTFEVIGDSPVEVEWNADVQSGLYFARVRARSSEGRTDTHLVKLAVIR